jgi:DNA-binding transcriptional LysR family regulator
MAQRFIGDLLFRFQLEHPNFLIELVVTDSVLDVVEHNIDLAIRVNPSKNSILVGGKVGVQQLLVVATPGYLKKHKRPKTLGDLCHHPLLYIDQHAQALSFLPKELQKKLEERRVFRTNDSPLLTKLLLNGESIGLRSSWDVKEGLKKKDLVLALPADSLKPTGDLWVLASAERLKSEAVREVYDFLVKKMKLFLA